MSYDETRGITTLQKISDSGSLPRGTARLTSLHLARSSSSFFFGLGRGTGGAVVFGSSRGAVRLSQSLMRRKSSSLIFRGNGVMGGGVGKTSGARGAGLV